MNNLLIKLNYKGQKRISVINAEESLLRLITEDTDDITVDQKIDPRFPYEFIMIFVKTQSDVESFAPISVHNLIADGVLWFCYPKKTSKKYTSDIDRDHGWKSLHDSGLLGIRMVSIDKDWAAFRFRNKKYVKSTSGRIAK